MDEETKKKLITLAEKWRARAGQLTNLDEDPPVPRTLRNCADELDELLKVETTVDSSEGDVSTMGQSGAEERASHMGRVWLGGGGNK